MEKHKYYTDQKRYEHCRKCRISGKIFSKYAKENGINRTTMRDWMHAYKNIHGRFINVNTVSEIEKKKRRNHFDRFDHSVVEIEYKGIKITTTLEQAEKLLERII